MKAAQRTTRATLIEYGAPAPVIHTLATDLGLARSVVRDQIACAGERVARLLSLPNNPIAVSDAAVRVCDVAGLLRVGPRLELEMAPKFLGTTWPNWREDFFFISTLSRHGRILAHERMSSTPGSRDDLATLVARAMISMYWDNHRRPLRTYKHSHVEDFAIDGEVDPESIVLPPIDGYAQRVVTYDRRNLFNATIHAASQALLSEVREPQVRRQLLRVVEVLSPQRPVRRAKYCRVPSRAKRWQSLYDLAVDVLNGFGITYQPASVRAPGFVLDTWRVWEDLLTVALRLSWGSTRIGAQRQLRLGERTSVEPGGKITRRTAWVVPDVAIKEGAGLLVDAKYKGRFGDTRNRIAESDLYEALAFATAAKDRRVVLVYPAIARDTPPRQTGTTTMFEEVVIDGVTITGMEVEVRGISRMGALRQFANGLLAALRPLTSASELPTPVSPAGP